MVPEKGMKLSAWTFRTLRPFGEQHARSPKENRAHRPPHQPPVYCMSQCGDLIAARACDNAMRAAAWSLVSQSQHECYPYTNGSARLGVACAASCRVLRSAVIRYPGGERTRSSNKSGGGATGGGECLAPYASSEVNDECHLPKGGSSRRHVLVSQAMRGANRK